MTAPRYPLSETAPEALRSHSGAGLADLTVDTVLAGRVGVEDARIAPETLRSQAAIARDAGRATLAANLERAAEMVGLSDARILEIYELLRPGRAASAEVLLQVAAQLRSDHAAPRLADFVEEAAAAYARRGLYQTRY